MWMQGFTSIRIEMPAKTSLQKIKTNSNLQMPKVKENQMLQEKHEAAVEEAKVPKDLVKKEIVKKTSSGKGGKMETEVKKNDDPPTDEEGAEQEDLDFKKTPAQPLLPKKVVKKKESGEGAGEKAEPKRKEIELKEELKSMEVKKRKAVATYLANEEGKQEEKKPSDKRIETKPKEEKQEPKA